MRWRNAWDILISIDPELNNSILGRQEEGGKVHWSSTNMSVREPSFKQTDRGLSGILLNLWVWGK